MKIENFLLFIIILSFSIKYTNSYEFSAAEVLGDPNNYKYQLCSGNGVPTYDPKANEIICKCNEGYTNEPDESKKEYINGHIIQCSYRQKSRFKTLFYALCLPFGLDYLYLGRYRIFAAVLCIFTATIALNITMFVINYKENMKNKENQMQNKSNKLRNDNRNKEKNENKRQKIIKILNIVANIGLIIHVLYMIITIILILTGAIDDYYGVKTENDLTYLFETYSDDE